MWLRRLLIGGLAALASACGEGLDRLADGGRGRVDEVLSGEVLRLSDGRTVRLAGVHAPGGDAERLLERLVEGREVALLHGGARADAYGRTLAHLRVFRGRRWVQGALLEAGVAQVRTRSDEAALAREMLKREARARSRRRGLWAEPGRGVRLPGEVDEEAGGFMIVEGRVRGTERVRDRLFVDFNQNGRRFAVEIPRRVLPDLESAGAKAESLPGRMVRVRGTVRPSRFGPVMTLDHAEQLELLQTDG